MGGRGSREPHCISLVLLVNFNRSEVLFAKKKNHLKEKILHCGACHAVGWTVNFKWAMGWVVFPPSSRLPCTV